MVVGNSRGAQRLYVAVAILTLTLGCGGPSAGGSDGGASGDGGPSDAGMDTSTPGGDAGPDVGPPVSCLPTQCTIDGACVDDGALAPGGCGRCDVGRDPSGYSPADATLVCRAAVGACDVEERCDGLSLDCPVDAFAATDAPCGDPTATACDAPDACDGAGACVPRFVASGTSCGGPDEVVTECDGADVCDGAGSCTLGLVTAGAPCGDETNTACDAADSCDGAGSCSPNYAPAATPCGVDPGPGACVLSTSCDGAGACPAPSPVADGTSCGAGELRCFDAACGPRAWIGLGPVPAPASGDDIRPLALVTRGPLSFLAVWEINASAAGLSSSTHESGSDTFGAPAAIPGASFGGSSATFGGVDFDATGRGSIVYVLGNAVYGSEHAAGSGSWAPPATVGSPATVSPRPAVAVSDDGSALMVYAYSTGDINNRPALVAAYRDSSGVYSPMPLTTGAYFRDRPQAVAWPSGDVAAIWLQEAVNGSVTMRARARLPGAMTPGWQAESVGPATSPESLRAIALDDGRLLVVYVEAGQTGANAIATTIWDPSAGSWTTPQSLGDATAEVPYGSLALASNGDESAVLAWVGRLYAPPQYGWQPIRDEYRIRARRFDVATDTWGGPITVVENESAYTTNVGQLSAIEGLQVAMNTSGDTLVGWVHENSLLDGGARDTQLEVRRFVPAEGAWAEPLDPGPGDSELPGSGWWAPVTLASQSDTPPFPLHTPRIALDDEGYAAVIWGVGYGRTGTDGLGSAVYR
ncbi:MAG: hypothetical protein KC668_09355 [Myxococcales bacterium]|nr:hypothetical protein [Myxococcales bacterium]